MAFVIQPSVCFIVSLQFMFLVIISESSAGEELQKLQEISVPLQPSSSTGQLTHFGFPFRTVYTDMSPFIRASLIVMTFATSMAMAHGNAAIACSDLSEQCLDSGTEECAQTQAERCKVLAKIKMEAAEVQAPSTWLLCSGDHQHHLHKHFNLHHNHRMRLWWVPRFGD